MNTSIDVELCNLQVGKGASFSIVFDLKKGFIFDRKNNPRQEIYIKGKTNLLKSIHFWSSPYSSSEIVSFCAMSSILWKKKKRWGGGGIRQSNGNNLDLQCVDVQIFIDSGWKWALVPRSGPAVADQLAMLIDRGCKPTLIDQSINTTHTMRLWIAKCKLFSLRPALIVHHGTSSLLCRKTSH